MSAPAVNPAPAPIVVADTAVSLQAVRRSLEADYALASADTLDGAIALVTPRTPAVLCGCHFEDGRIYDLLRHLKASEHLRHIPFLAIRVLEGELDDVLYQGVEVAIEALGGDGFVDVYRCERLHGEAQAHLLLLRRVQALLEGGAGRKS